MSEPKIPSWASAPVIHISHIHCKTRISVATYMCMLNKIGKAQGMDATVEIELITLPPKVFEDGTTSNVTHETVFTVTSNKD